MADWRPRDLSRITPTRASQAAATLNARHVAPPQRCIHWRAGQAAIVRRQGRRARGRDTYRGQHAARGVANQPSSVQPSPFVPRATRSKVRHVVSRRPAMDDWPHRSDVFLPRVNSNLQRYYVCRFVGCDHYAVEGCASRCAGPTTAELLQQFGFPTAASFLNFELAG